MTNSREIRIHIWNAVTAAEEIGASVVIKVDVAGKLIGAMSEADADLFEIIEISKTTVQIRKANK